MNVFKFNKMLKETSITSRLISILYDKEKKNGFLFNRPLDELIKENYKELIENKYPDNLPYILSELYTRDSLKTFIKENMLFNLMMASNSEFAIIIRNNYGIDWYQYIEENIDILLKKLNCEKVQKIVRTFPNLKKDVKEKINEYLVLKKRGYIEYLLFGKLKEYKNEKEYQDLLDIMIKLVDEVLEHESLSYFDIVKRQSGHYSEVVEIGTKIIKLGKNRRKYRIPYDKRILLPLIRVDLSKISKMQVVLEVTEKVNVEAKLSEESIYFLFKELRERGIICTDMRVENIGVLLRDNVPHWDKLLCTNNKNKGIYSTYQEQPLGVGDKVILDLDYIYKENATKIDWPDFTTKEYELRYQEEKNNEQNKVKKRGGIK